MKFTVELEDFYLEEGELKVELAAMIKNDVLFQIRTLLKTQIDAAITEKVREEVTATLKEKISNYVEVVIENETINSRYKSGEKISLKEWVKECFEKDNATGWNGIQDTVKKVATNLAADMKNRYDLMFASQFVAKMNENGLLKEDIAKLLLEPPVKKD